MIPPTSIMPTTIMSGRTFGKMCRAMTRTGDAPIARAASTNSRSRSAKVCPRERLQIPSHPSRPMNTARLTGSSRNSSPTMMSRKSVGMLLRVLTSQTITAKVAPQGPYVIKGSKLPASVLPAVKDIAAYIDGGKASAALEFVSPVKGPSLEQICVAVGSGQVDAQTAAANYDKDVEKQAKQLGLP